MRHRKAFASLLLLVALCVGSALASESPAVKSKAATGNEVAVFTVPGLLEGTTLKSLAQALAKKPGIVSAQVDAEKGTFNVTFEPKKTNPDEILQVVASVSKDAKLVEVTPATGKTAAGPDCGKCPSARSCSKAKK